MTKPSAPNNSPHQPPCNVPVGGIQKLSLVDFPGHVAAALFTAGCNMRCGYCHNPELVLPERLAPSIPIDDIMLFLQSRVGRLDGVVVSGGEPTIHDDLPELIRRIKALGYDMKLDSNGTRPEMIRQLIDDKMIDFVAMDIKGPLEKYQMIAARPIDLEAVQETIALLISSGIGHEFRTTIVREQLEPNDFHKVGEMVRGAKRFALQHFRPGSTLAPQFEQASTFSESEFQETKTIMEGYVDECVIH